MLGTDASSQGAVGAAKSPAVHWVGMLAGMADGSRSHSGGCGGVAGGRLGRVLLGFSRACRFTSFSIVLEISCC